MREFDDLKELLQGELKKINKKGDLTPSELDNATKVMCLLESIEKYKSKYEMDEGRVEGYSSRMYRPTGYGDAYGYPNNGGYSNNGSRRSTGVRRGGYNGHSDNDSRIEMLEGMLAEAKTESERRTIMDFVDRLSD